MFLTESTLRDMIEFTLLHNTDTVQEIREFAQQAREGNFAMAYVMPCYSALVAEILKGSRTLAGGAVAFPTGSEPIDVKCAMTRYHINAGAGEIDYVININMLKSGDYDFIAEEARQIILAAQNHPVKAIIEVTLLTDDEIKRVSKCLVDAGVDYIKTGTGTQPNPTTVEHVRLIHDAILGECKIKAAGGIRTIDAIIEMIRLGTTRFGISRDSAYRIIEEFKDRYPKGIEI